MNGLPDFDPQGEIGRQVNATRLNALVGGLRGGKLQPSKGMRHTETAGGTTAVPIVKRYPQGVTPPFWPRFKPSGEGAAKDWVVTISRGVVFDMNTTDSDAIIPHELLDLIDADGNPAEFEISAGQAVYVAYGVTDVGAVKADADKPRIVIADAGAESLHYDPPAGVETSGDDGSMNRMLAIFDVDADGTPIPEMFEAGDNIQHWRELPIIKTMGGSAGIFRDYDLATGIYRTRGLTAGAGITLTENNDDIEIARTGGAGLNLNLEIYLTSFSHDVDGHLVATRATSPEVTLYFRSGILVSKTDPDGGSPPGDLTTEQVDRTNAPAP